MTTRQTIHIHSRVHRDMPAQPVTYGVPWPKGAIKSEAELVLRDEAGETIPAAFTTLNRWEDGSAQWTLLDTSLDLAPSAHVALIIESAKAKAVKPRNPVTIAIDGDTARIGNGLVELVVSSKRGELVRSWKANGKPFVKDEGFDITFDDADGRTFSLRAGTHKLTIEHANGCRAVLRLDGRHGRADGSRGDWLDYFLRIEIFAGRDDVKVTHCFRNREEATPGIAIRNFVARFDTAVSPTAKRCFTANTRTRHYLTEPMRVSEDPEIVASDTGDLDNYAAAHKDRANADCFVRNPEVLHDPMEAKPWWLRDIKFRLQAGGSKCVWPYLAIVDEKLGAVASIDRMTCLHPKSLTVRGSVFELALYPDWAGPLKITQGAGRSHVMRIGPVDPKATDVDIQDRYLSWEYGGIHTHVPSGTPVEIKPDLDHVRACAVFQIHKLPAYEPVRNFAFERKVMDAWIGVSYGQLGAVDQVNHWPAAGLWHFGDQGGGNNEEMHNLVYFQNYFRSGNWGCAEFALTGSYHMMEVDHCAYSTDRLQTGGQVAHTTDHNNGTAYPSHEWFTEYLFAYVLTGDREFLEAGKRTCEHLLYWINTPEGFQIIAADQREAGQPMINLTWFYEFTRDQRYLDGCWTIVRDYLMANTEKYGRMLDAKPFVNPVKVCSYGDYAAWEGMYWLWEITRDEGLKSFMLSQLEWRVAPEFCGVHGFHRTTDYNPAAYAFYLTGDRKWLERVAYPFWHAFRAARWPLGWVHAMYFTKLAFDHHMVSDTDVLVQ
ncbi:MAG: hypothetical protein K8S99_04040 [Planctomycetes bacterium]|nr:hypothetical protein [Planctomycetota bacterium]